MDGEEQAALLHPDPGAREARVRESANDIVGHVLVVAVAVEAGALDLVRDRDALHGTGGEAHLAVRRHHQRVACEIAPVVEPGEVVDVLGHGDYQAIEPVPGHRGPHRRQAAGELLVREDRCLVQFRAPYAGNSLNPAVPSRAIWSTSAISHSR